ncbi:hypothetical protein PQU92_03320 [Asticcacaulis sp. BYS171W]|uniref:Phage holin family protein n=1 Tax=Asticcacaulis aquaticus TaxID=2984212 RepID=A0ABT5HQG4_9CAUL|nr:hypothetical protein [Asticcacaulis aquaticus]MDC7682289.1 hypothetical protein [Asticcacaulis aquaticus]
MFNLSEQLSELRDSIIAVVLLVAAAILGVAWASIGLFNALQIWLGPVWGPVALGAAMILPLAIYMLIKRLTKEEKKRQQTLAKQQTQAFYTQSSVVHIQRILDALKGRSPVLATVGAVIAGFLASKFPSMLAVLSEIIGAWGDDVKRKTAEHDD